jgi:hypothetical protein
VKRKTTNLLAPKKTARRHELSERSPVRQVRGGGTALWRRRGGRVSDSAGRHTSAMAAAAHASEKCAPMRSGTDVTLQATSTASPPTFAGREHGIGDAGRGYRRTERFLWDGKGTQCPMGFRGLILAAGGLRLENTQAAYTQNSAGSVPRRVRFCRHIVEKLLARKCCSFGSAVATCCSIWS